MNYDGYEALKIEKNGSILTITIDRPEVKNAVNPQVHDEFSRIFLDVDRDPEVSVVILTGAGDAFSAGGDIDWLTSLHGDMAATVASIENDRRIQNAMLDLEKPIIARVVGPAVGLGCSLALFCDFVYATPEARFADPHVAVALVAGDGGAVIWPQLIGYARARKYLLTGDPIFGAEAAEIGLITASVPIEEIDEVVAAMANRMASGATQAIKWTKASINAGLKVTANAIIDRAAGYENLTMLTEDHKIAVDAFRNRTKPAFVGR
ncbi:enoyl-CoA hydratase/isomerase family protein [Parasphingopyxis marina]|uniref:Enoyl-CoA hydratase/isomerase family protein n=1 Tax=Parasphingopyxis marina TaxID=2761622 RepID=A0A842I3H7_9SPHN|nr:enoyl-CoA hydratase/isomerase family protein [Parasphingopyxis marina]MBC2778960.1 enoyl-CoA hydratase/isomerase family protein [Parasphingopyxis marina]